MAAMALKPGERLTAGFFTFRKPLLATLNRRYLDYQHVGFTEMSLIGFASRQLITVTTLIRKAFDPSG